MRDAAACEESPPQWLRRFVGGEALNRRMSETHQSNYVRA